MVQRPKNFLFRGLLAIGVILVTFYLVAGNNDQPLLKDRLQHITWQSHQVAFVLPKHAASDTSPNTYSLQSSTASVKNEWNPYAENDAPITELYLASCAFPPSLFNDACQPPSSPAEDAVRGKWIRLNKDLNRHSLGLWYLYLYYRRRQPNAVSTPVIDGVRFLTPQDANVESTKSTLQSEGWKMIHESLHSGIWRGNALNLWYKSARTGNGYTEFDVVFGKSALRPGWEDIGIISQMPNKAIVKLQGRRQSTRKAMKKPQLRFSTSGNFTIMQIADLHFSNSDGLCRDIVNNTACPAIPEAADIATLKWLLPVIRSTKPDLIMLTGDQLNGQKTSWAAASVINKVAAFFSAVQIPWTVSFGNHDSEETDLSRSEQMKIYESLPYFVGSAGPPSVDGVGNYRLPLYSADPSNTTLFNLYFLDSHAYYKPFFGAQEYDWIKDSQIDWFRSESNQVKPILRPYKPADLSYEEGPFNINGGFDKRQAGNEQFLKPNAMAIWHIPVAEAYDPPDKSLSTGQPLEFGTVALEKFAGPKKNSGFFTKAILQQTEAGNGIGSSLPEVKVTVHGHSHLRDACSRIKGVWMCFSGGSSYSGYGMLGFDRRVRVYQISDFGETIQTYKLLDGSGVGSRTDGSFASASRAAATSTSTKLPDQTDDSIADVKPEPVDANVSQGQYKEELGSLVDELKAEEEAVQQTNPGEAAALQELVNEISQEEQVAAIERSNRRKRQMPIGSRYQILDYLVLVGRGAIA